MSATLAWSRTSFCAVAAISAAMSVTIWSRLRGRRPPVAGGAPATPSAGSVSMPMVIEPSAAAGRGRAGGVEAEQIRAARRQEPHGRLERERLLVAHPVAEQMGREARVAELARVRAGVREAEDDGWILQQLGDDGLVGVGHRHAEARLE